MTQPLKVDPDLKFIRRIRSLGGDPLKKCFQCATCSVVCERSPEENPFPRKEMIWAQWGLKDKLLADPDVWLCYRCSDCSVQCPRGARPAEVLGAVRTAAVERYAFPRILARACASPKGLPFLLLIAAGVVFFLVWWTGQKTGTESWGLNAPLPVKKADGRYEGGYFGNFLEHGPVEMIFIGGNILVMCFVAFSLLRFWRDMKKAYGKPESLTFFSSLIETFKEIIPHRAFKDCTANRPNYFAHLLVFYGFFGAMATAGLAVLDMKLLGHHPPIPFFHPIKILGNLSFLALVGGSFIMIFRRLFSKDKVGQTSYSDWVFLLALFFTALTGGLTQLGRQLDNEAPALSYLFYFVHMSVVFFLLWYAPYSKFAHLFYRTTAIAFAKSIGRSKNGSGKEPEAKPRRP
jgi:quinone-modifying oxidoreductase subunit QmoC